MPKSISICLFVLMSFLASTTFGQEEEEHEIDWYFDDGGSASSKNFLKINGAYLVAGDLHFSYERKLNKAFHIEVGLGVLMPWSVDASQNIFSEDPIVPERETPRGWSYSIEARSYGGRSSENHGYGMLFRGRYYNFSDTLRVKTRDIAITMHYNVRLHNRVSLDLGYGAGFRFLKKEHSQDPPVQNPVQGSIFGEETETPSLVIPLMFKLVVFI